MYRIANKPISTLAFIPLILLIALSAACGVIDVENDATATPVPTATAATSSPAATTARAPTNTPTSTPAVVLVCPNNERVELSVLVEPLDTGNVEIAGSGILTSGGATPVCKDDQMNIIARANDGWRFDPWELDVTGTRVTQVIVMTISKQVRAFFVRVDDRTPEPQAFYGITLNGQPVHNLMIGVDNGSIEVSPAPGPGEDPFREGTIVSLTLRPDDGYELEA